MEIQTENFGPVVLKARVVAHDSGVFLWQVRNVNAESRPAANPVSGCTIFARVVAAQSGECGSAHEAEFRAAAAMVAMATEQRELLAKAEAELATRNHNHAAAVAATERLDAL